MSATKIVGRRRPPQTPAEFHTQGAQLDRELSAASLMSEQAPLLRVCSLLNKHNAQYPSMRIENAITPLPSLSGRATVREASHFALGNREQFSDSQVFKNRRNLHRILRDDSTQG